MIPFCKHANNLHSIIECISNSVLPNYPGIQSISFTNSLCRRHLRILGREWINSISFKNEDKYKSQSTNNLYRIQVGRWVHQLNGFNASRSAGTAFQRGGPGLLCPHNVVMMMIMSLGKSHFKIIRIFRKYMRICEILCVFYLLSIYLSSITMGSFSSFTHLWLLGNSWSKL